MSYPRENTLRKSATAAANTAVTVEIPDPGNSLCIRIQRVIYSYSAAPTGGQLTIEDGRGGPIEIGVAEKGPEWLPFGHQAKAETAVKATLAAGGAGVAGSLTVIYTVE